MITASISTESNGVRTTCAVSANVGHWAPDISTEVIKGAADLYRQWADGYLADLVDEEEEDR